MAFSRLTRKQFSEMRAFCPCYCFSIFVSKTLQIFRNLQNDDYDDNNNVGDNNNNYDNDSNDITNNSNDDDDNINDSNNDDDHDCCSFAATKTDKLNQFFSTNFVTFSFLLIGNSEGPSWWTIGDKQDPFLTFVAKDNGS